MDKARRRGKRADVDVQFSTVKEMPVFPVRPKLGEEGGLIIYAEPSHNVIGALTKSVSVIFA